MMLAIRVEVRLKLNAVSVEVIHKVEASVHKHSGARAASRNPTPNLSLSEGEAQGTRGTLKKLYRRLAAVPARPISGITDTNPVQSAPTLASTPESDEEAEVRHSSTRPGREQGLAMANDEPNH